MGEHENREMICPECGNCPVEVGGGVAEYTDRVRRRVLWVWVGLVILLGALGLPWVRVWLGNTWAIYREAPTVHDSLWYHPLAEPPVRWRDLKRAAEGDTAAIEQFRGAIARFDEGYPNLAAHELDEYSFEIVEPRDFVNDPSYSSSSNRVDYGEFEGQGYVYSLWRYREESRGWPLEWVYRGINDTYAYGDRRFQTDGVRSVDHDMIHKAARGPMRIVWLNLLFFGVVASLCGTATRKAFLWRFASPRGARIAGLIVVGLLAGVVVAGYSHRVFRDENVIEGSFDPLSPDRARVWTRGELNEQVASAIAIQVFAGELVDDLGTMTEPNALLGMGIHQRAVSEKIRLSFGLWFIELFAVERATYYKSEADGTLTPIPVPATQYHPAPTSLYGTKYVDWKWGKRPAVKYGVLIAYRDLVLAGVGLIVLYKVFGWVGGLWYRRVQHRRLERRECVWCRYRCGG